MIDYRSESQKASDILLQYITELVINKFQFLGCLGIQAKRQTRNKLCQKNKENVMWSKQEVQKFLQEDFPIQEFDKVFLYPVILQSKNLSLSPKGPQRAWDL